MIATVLTHVNPYNFHLRKKYLIILNQVLNQLYLKYSMKPILELI